MSVILLLVLFLIEMVWTKTLQLDKNLQISWISENNEAVIKVEASIGKQDWVGVGFSDYGSVEGADLCALWRDWRGNLFFSDIHVTEDGVVEMDKQNNCQGMRWRQINKHHNNNPVLEYEYRRDHWTCDSDDYRIEDGTTHVVWAIGRGPLFQLSGLNLTSSANVVTGMTRTRFIQTQEEVDTDSVPFLVNLANQTIPDSETTYWCSVVKLPPAFNRKHHVTEYRAFIEEQSRSIVHHMEVYHCEGEKEFPLWSGQCRDESEPEALKKCKKVLAAWALGAGPFQYPIEAGLEIGGKGFSPYVMLEVHFNNQERRSGVVDSSGIQFAVTKKLRRFDAGILELGLEYNNKMAIPPGLSEFTLSGTCVQECTAVSLPKSGFVIFGSQLHTHGTGRRVETTLVREGRETMVNIDKHYSTHFQEIRQLVKPVHVMPGDALVTTCHYTTLDRENITLGGYGFSEEMCVNYVHYYPKTELEVCKSSVDTGDLYDYFEELQVDEGQDTARDKSVEENYRSIRWNKKRSLGLDQLYTQGSIAMQCHRGTGEPFQGTWTKLPQVKIPQKYEEVEQECDNKFQHDASPLIESRKRTQEHVHMHKRGQNKEHDCHHKPSHEPSFELSEENSPIFKNDLVAGKKRKATKRMDNHIHMHKRLMNKYSETWDDYDAWGFNKRSDTTPSRPSLSLEDEPADEFNIEDFLEANEALIHL